MTYKILFAITTYKKPLALENLLNSLVENKYTDVIVCDDNSNKDNISELLEKYKNSFENLIFAYNQKTQQTGISCNKNRGIKYFIENAEKYDALILLDDDVVLTSQKIPDHLENIKNTYDILHISGYWTDESAFNTSKLTGLTGNQWSSDFPTIMENELVFFANGCQGCFVWIDKKLVLKAGYFKKFPYHYGCEHSEYSSRLNKITGWSVGVDNGEDPLFPMLKRSEKFFHGQFIPNNYNVNHNTVTLSDGTQVLEAKNMKKYKEYLSEIRKGIDLYNDDPGFPRKGEVLTKIS